MGNIREPLEGRAPSLFIWTVVLAVTAAGVRGVVAVFLPLPQPDRLLV
jgi:NhaP-type Na+/H+ or K+/H+ antiporter